MRGLSNAQKMRVAHANGVNTIGEYAQYQKRNRERTNQFPDHMNKAIASMVDQEKKGK